MYEIEIWLDIQFSERGTTTTACTLFGRHEMPVRPHLGESISYHQHTSQDKPLHYFMLATTFGPMKEHSITVAVEEISHYAAATEHGQTYKMALRLEAVTVVSLQDARELCSYLCNQHDFEVDPYGVNKLTEAASGA